MLKYTIADIVQNQLCIGCGICTSEAESSQMIWNEDGFLVPDISQPFNDTAIKLCPFNPAPEKEVENEDQLAEIFFANTKNWDKKMGKFENIYVGYSQEFRETSSSGGLSTFIFKKLLDQKIVDHLFIVKEMNGSYAYQWFNQIDDILQISKTRYIPVTLENLFTEIDGKEGRVAVSGVACFVKAIRLKQHYRPEYKEKIPFVVGIICGGLKSKFYTDYLAQKAEIKGRYSHQEYRIKNPDSFALDYSFGAFNEQKVFQSVEMRKLGDMWGTGLFKANACDFCEDVTTELADISLGDAWIPPYKNDGLGTSVIVTRTLLADQLIRRGKEENEIQVENLSITKFKASQDGSYKHRQKALRFRLKVFKIKTGISLHKRKRISESIPFEFRKVQKERMNLRKESIEQWNASHNANDYELKIQPMKEKLEKATLFYHRVQKLKRMFKMKTL